MQDTLFALIQARIIQTALNGDLNLFRVGADISACRPTVSARCTAIFRWLTIPFRAAAGFRRILTRAEIAKQIVDAFCGGRFFGSRFLLSVRRCFRRRGIRFLLRLRRRFRRLGIRFLLRLRRRFRRFGFRFLLRVRRRFRRFLGLLLLLLRQFCRFFSLLLLLLSR